MFRSVAHGACVRSGKPAPNERIQRELADELRANVCSCASLLRTQLSQKISLLSIGLGDIVCFNVIVDHALSLPKIARLNLVVQCHHFI